MEENEIKNFSQLMLMDKIRENSSKDLMSYIDAVLEAEIVQ
jgi:hypothetical protein